MRQDYPAVVHEMIPPRLRTVGAIIRLPDHSRVKRMRGAEIG